MNAKTEAKVIDHGRTLVAVFGLPESTDPVALCRKLRRLESEGERLGLRLCNGPEFQRETDPDDIGAAILGKVDALLHFKGAGIPVFLNRDPRGYALKIDDLWVSKNMARESVRGLHRDWGGYGIITPDLSE